MFLSAKLLGGRSSNLTPHLPPFLSICPLCNSRWTCKQPAISRFTAAINSKAKAKALNATTHEPAKIPTKQATNTCKYATSLPHTSLYHKHKVFEAILIVKIEIHNYNDQKSILRFYHLSIF